MTSNKPTLPKTTCGKHRTLGYAFKAGISVCRGCGLPADHHETFDETLARKQSEAKA